MEELGNAKKDGDGDRARTDAAEARTRTSAHPTAEANAHKRGGRPTCYSGPQMLQTNMAG